MTFKEYIDDMVETIKHMKIGSKNGLIMLGSIIGLSFITTPLIGIPLGFWIGYYLEKNGN